MDVDRACLTVKVEAPGLLQNLLAAEDESAVFGEREEQVEFLGAEVEDPRRDSDLPARRVYGYVTEMDRSRVICFYRALAAPQNRFDTGHKLPRIKGLGQVVIRAQFQTEDLIDIFIASCKHQNGNPILQSSQATTDFKAIQFWEHDIQDYQGRLEPFHFFQGDFAVIRRLGVKSLSFEIHPRKLDDGRLIIYEEDQFVHDLQ